jgi:glycosyltransferase involved in cell wall biosynthesis
MSGAGTGSAGTGGVGRLGHAARAPGSVLLVEEGGVGGVADYTDALAGALAAAGWKVHLATGRDHAVATPPGVVVHRMFPYVRGRGPVGRLVRRAHLSRVVNGATHLAADALIAGMARRCQVVHVQGEEWPPLGAALAGMLRVAGRPVLYTPHNTFSRDGRSYARANALIRRWAHTVVVHSHYDLGALAPDEAAKAVVIPHGEYGGLARRGAPDADVQRSRAELGAGEDELVVLLFGRLRADKGIADLLLASAATAGVRVVLAGEDDGGLAPAQDLLADPRLRGRVVLRRGFVEPARMGRLFAAADVVALPYRQASASGVLLLAYGYGRPVVAYPVGGLPEYVLDGHTGWLCDRADPDALATQLAEIVRAGRAECRKRGREAREVSEQRYGWDAIAARTIECYERARDGRGDRAP